jgi:hypothetical protein
MEPNREKGDIGEVALDGTRRRRHVARRSERGLTCAADSFERIVELTCLFRASE